MVKVADKVTAGSGQIECLKVGGRRPGALMQNSREALFLYLYHPRPGWAHCHHCLLLGVMSEVVR